MIFSIEFHLGRKQAPKYRIKHYMICQNWSSENGIHWFHGRNLCQCTQKTWASSTILKISIFIIIISFISIIIIIILCIIDMQRAFSQVSSQHLSSKLGSQKKLRPECKYQTHFVLSLRNIIRSPRCTFVWYQSSFLILENTGIDSIAVSRSHYLFVENFVEFPSALEGLPNLSQNQKQIQKQSVDETSRLV